MLLNDYEKDQLVSEEECSSLPRLQNVGLERAFLWFKKYLKEIFADILCHSFTENSCLEAHNATF